MDFLFLNYPQTRPRRFPPYGRVGLGGCDERSEKFFYLVGGLI